MSKQVKATLTLIGGTIGVGFLALPYSIYKFGTFWGIMVLVLAGGLILITNLTYSDIITSDKGNRQVPGYTKKYLGEVWGHLIMVVIIGGSTGTLLAYGIISGSALKVLLSAVNINLSATFLGLIFVAFALFVMRYGMKIIANVSSKVVLALIFAIVFLVIISLPNVNLENTSALNLKEFSRIFGVSIFALYSAGAIPVIDEIIGYNRKKYRKAILTSTLVSLSIYIIFGLILSLSLGNSLTSNLVNSFGEGQKGVASILSLLTLLAIFSAFIIIANNIKEILSYDYKIPSSTSVLFISVALMILLLLEVTDFDTLISLIGNIALALQSLFIFAIWFRSQKKVSALYKVIVAIGGAILIGGMVMQI